MSQGSDYYSYEAWRQEREMQTDELSRQRQKREAKREERMKPRPEDSKPWEVAAREQDKAAIAYMLTFEELKKLYTGEPIE